MITIEEAIKRLKEARFTVQPYQYINEALDMAIEALEQEPKIGRWIKSNIGGAKVCSVCKAHMGLSSFKYCPNCGSRMEGAE